MLCLAISLGLAACQPEPTPFIQPLSEQPLRQPARALQPAACPFTVPEGENITCGIVEAPKDPNQPLGEKVSLQVVLYASESPSPAPEAVVYLGFAPPVGGFFGGRGVNRTIERLRQTREVIRYTRLEGAPGAPTPTAEPQCPEIESVYLDWLQGKLSLAGRVEQTLAAYQACRARLEAGGGVAQPPTLDQRASDFAALRQALGAPRLNLVGFGENTLLILRLMETQPDALRSAAILQFYPPMALADQQASFTLALQRLFAACGDDETCHSTFPDLESEFLAVLAQLEAAPLTLEVKHPTEAQMITVQVDAATFLFYLRDLFSTPDSIARIPLLIHQIAQGEGYRLAADVQNLLMFRSFFGQGDSVAPECTERWSAAPIAAPGSADVYPVLQQALQFEYDLMAQVCEAWHQTPFAPPQLQPGEGAIPLLVLHGAYDPYFAPELVEAWLDGFSHAQSVVFPYQGAFFFGGDCPARLIDEFFQDPTRRVDPSCAQSGGLTFQKPLQ